MIACLLTALIETPFLFLISNLVDGDDHWSPYTVVMFLSGLQFAAIAFYFMAKGLKPFAVPRDSWKMLLIRSLLYCAAINMFVVSLERLNPPCALLALHSGILGATCIIRVLMREQMVITLTIVKVCQIGVFLQLCLIPGLATVKTDKFDKDYTLTTYWIDLAIGLTAGLLLGVVSRMTSYLCGEGRLNHEAYMTFWQSLLTLIISPIMIGVYIYNQDKVKSDLSAEQTAQLAEVLTALFFLGLFKCVYIERDIMKRFVEDYEADTLALDDPDRPGTPEIEMKQ